MERLLDTALVFPTVIFSLGLMVVVIYWTLVIIGILDIDIFGADVDVDLDIDGDADVDAHGSFADVLSRLDLSDVPLTVSFSLVVLGAWLVTVVAVQTLGPIATTLVYGSLIAVAAVAASAFVARGLVIPLKPFFAQAEAPNKRSLVGQICEITTLRVDDKYGQADVNDGGAGLVIQVRSASADELVRGSEALIYDYDPAADIFYVKPTSRDTSAGSDVFNPTSRDTSAGSDVFNPTSRNI